MPVNTIISLKYLRFVTLVSLYNVFESALFMNLVPELTEMRIDSVTVNTVSKDLLIKLAFLVIFISWGDC